MFHTPPKVDPLFDQESRKSSYNPELGSGSGPVQMTKQNNEPSNVTEEVLVRLQSGTTTLPDELMQELDNFIKFLKQPKFNHPLNLDDISRLYQQFYADFDRKSVAYWTKHWDLEDISANELLTKQELKDRTDRQDKMLDSVFLSNLLIEKLVCNKYYDKIFRSDKNLVKDEMNRLINLKLKEKLKKLGKFPIDLKSNLDLDIDLNENDQLLLFTDLEPLFKEMFEIKSPTLKLLKFKKIHELINQFFKKNDIKVNGDFYLPILIYSMIKIPNLAHDNDLILELNFIKNFKNNSIYESNNNNSNYSRNNSNQIGELLYILTNLDACLIYLLNVTLTDLKVDTVTSEPLLSGPIVIDESSLTYCDDYQAIKKNAKNNTVLDYYSSRLQEYAFYNADQGIRTIGNAFDSSVKSVFGRFLPSSVGSTTSAAASQAKEVDKIGENFNIKLEEEVISPVSTTSTLNTSNSSGSAGPSSKDSDAAPPLTQVPTLLPLPLSSSHHHSSSYDLRNLSLKNFSNSMTGVIKQFRPISSSNSSTSLLTHQSPPTDSGSNGTKNRSRGASLVGEVLSQQPFSRSSSNGFLSNIEHAFEGRRSRGNSLLGLGEKANNGANTAASNGGLNAQLKKEFKENGWLRQSFEDMSVADLHKMFDNYCKLMNC